MSSNNNNITKHSSRVDQDLIVGIDLGTTYSSCAVYMNQQLIDIKDAAGSAQFPSVVRYTEYHNKNNNNIFLSASAGLSAQQNAASNNDAYQQTITWFKRLMGRRARDAIIADDLKKWPCTITETTTTNNTPQIRIKLNNIQTLIPPERVAADILRHIIQAAEEQCDCLFSKAVISVPAYFTNAQREATKTAAGLIGLDAVRLINEPTAAALNWAVQMQHNAPDGNILVFDLGGGTFDVSILQVKNHVFTVLSTGGDAHCGGDDVDNNLLEYLKSIQIPKHIEKFKQQQQQSKQSTIAPSDDSESESDLSDDDNNNNTNSNNNIIDFGAQWKIIQNDQNKKLSFDRQALPLLRAFKHNFTNSHVVRFKHKICGLPFDFKLTRAEFHKFITTDLLKKTLPHVDKALAATKLTPQDISKVLLVGGSTRLPAIAEELIPKFGRAKICQQVDVDLAVSRGAAIQAAMLSKNLTQRLTQVVLRDVSNLPLGIRVASGALCPLIQKHSPLPATNAEVFVNAEDDQQYIRVAVYEGDNLDYAEGNAYLGEVHVDLGKKYKKHQGAIDVRFEATMHGVLGVTAYTHDTKQLLSSEMKWDGLLDKADADLIIKNQHYERRVVPVKDRTTRELKRLIKICQDVEKALSSQEQYKFKTNVVSKDDLVEIKKTLTLAKLTEQWLNNQHLYDQSVSKDEYINRHLALSSSPGIDFIEEEAPNVMTC